LRRHSPVKRVGTLRRVDRFALETFGLRLPYPYQKYRGMRILQVHAELCARYEALLASYVGRLIREKAEARYP